MRKAFTLAAALMLSMLPAAAQKQSAQTAPPPPPPVPAGARRKVAVLDFNYATVMTSVQAIFGTNQDIGKGITDLLVDKLVNDATYRVIERAAIAKIMAEQNFSNSNRVDTSSAAKIGKLLGVDAIIIGDITQFGRDDSHKGAGGIGSSLGRYGLGQIGIQKAKCTVAITGRLIDVNTGEILASVTGEGTSQRTGSNLLGGGGTPYSGGGGGVNMGSSNFAQTIIGEAIRGAVTQLGGNLDAKASMLPVNETPRAVVNGMVADVSGNQLILNVGSSQGLQVGDVLQVARTGRVIKDPATGKPLRSIDTQLGTVAITSVDSGSSVGTFTGSEVKVGDKIGSK
ncbi:MAG TPA: CsgG/HfaB family protein [Acidobacteriaceae bacterium]|jgi:curli biogenesis system outer membrane secretion channel CsgG